MTLNPLKTNRHEIKFLLNWRQYLAIKKEIQQYCQIDKHVPKGHENYRVTSLYYDSPDMRSYLEGFDGDQIKKKIRLRSYSNTTSVFIELKEKYGQIVNKKRVMTSSERAYQFMRNPEVEILGDNLSEKEISELNEIRYLITRYKMQPKVVVSYIRYPFVSIYDHNTRVTFDYNVCFRDYDLSVDGSCGEKILPSGCFILEVKYNSLLPKWLIPILNRHNIKLQKMSKFGDSIEKLINGYKIKYYQGFGF